jgi:hypothetical protein
VSVFLAGKWFVVPCIVPFPLDGSVPVDNLLGMGGILDGHLFCMAREELVLFRRPVATSGEEKNIA